MSGGLRLIVLRLGDHMKTLRSGPKLSLAQRIILLAGSSMMMDEYLQDNEDVLTSPNT